LSTVTDLVVVLPGLLGSSLRLGDKLVWAPSAGSAIRAITTFGAVAGELRLPDDLGDEHPGDGVDPVGLMPGLHVLPGVWAPVKGYDRLIGRLRSLGFHEQKNLLPLPYDWRLSHRYNARRLKRIIEPALQRWREQGGAYADARVVLVGHSAGGLIARYYVEHCGGAEIVRAVVTFGTPYRGAVKTLAQLVNGVRKGVGPLAPDLTALIRSMPSMYQLLPGYACVEHDGDLVRATEVTLPELDAAKVADGLLFHAELTGSDDITHAVAGVQQPTSTTARLAGSRVELVESYRGEDLFGDGTVPLLAATRATLFRVPEVHGNLQRNPAALDALEGVLTDKAITVRVPRTVDLHVGIPDLVLAGEYLLIDVATADDRPHKVRITATDESGRVAESRVAAVPADGLSTTVIDGLAPGAYAIRVEGISPSSPVSPVNGDVLIWG
jgi:pimeloyl-ACP methyl ester carboxylesterase